MLTVHWCCVLNQKENIQFVIHNLCKLVHMYVYSFVTFDSKQIVVLYGGSLLVFVCKSISFYNMKIIITDGTFEINVHVFTGLNNFCTTVPKFEYYFCDFFAR